MTTTTNSKGQTPRIGGSGVLLSAAVATLLAGSLIVIGGALAAGTSAAYGAAIGVGITAAVFLLGSLMVNTVAGLVPSASLLVALMTYVLQVVLMAVIFATLSNASVFEDPTPRVWLAAGVISATATWVVAHIWLATRQRIPHYDLSSAGSTPEVPEPGTGVNHDRR